MCYSAPASFAVAATLLPAGLYCVRQLPQIGSKWIVLAVYPILFSIQQGLEGFVWLGLAANDQALIDRTARGFLFFSHFLWLFWVPFSVYWLEPEPERKRLLLGLLVVGAFAGITVYMPILLNQSWLIVEQSHHSIVYRTTLIYDDIIHRTILRSAYALIILGSLFLSSHKNIQWFGGIIALSLLIANLFFNYALISIWCFFAAVAALSIVVLIKTSAIRRARETAEAAT